MVVVTTWGIAGASASAQSITEKQADEILKELRQIRQLLERQMQPQALAAPPQERVKLPSPAGYIRGRVDAPVTIVEFTDLECPFCSQFHKTVFQEIKKNYIDTGKVRLVTLDFPLDIHPNAKNAATAARCGGEQGKFWELRDAFATNADKLSTDAVLGYAGGLGLDLKAFQSCLASGKFEAALLKDADAAIAAGVSGTPTFVIGKTNSAEDGWKIVGARPYAIFEERIKQILEPGAAR